ncbi:MAG: alanine racemase [Oscillospiraceae bacterium]|nr:alanine racemase [Oscillospiraceae bacterium]
MEYSNSHIKIDLDAILENFRAIRAHAKAEVMAVIKANAYGHGAIPVAQLLEKECAFFGVSSVAEALELRRAGIQKPILILGATDPNAFDVLVKEDIRPTIFTYQQAQKLSDEAQKQGKTACFHIAVDTGMSRIGLQVTEQSADICAEIAKLPGITAEGLFSHFATADEKDQTKTQKQAQLFADFDRMLKARGVEIKLRHLDNSAGVLGYGSHYEMVRTGIILYGLYPDAGMDKTIALKPAMSWHSWVAHVKPLEPGRQISYGGTFTVEKPMLVATVPVGYADGYRRNLSGRFYVLIRGQRAPILGRVCMDQFMVDVTDIPEVVEGDEVVLLGTSGAETITAEALAAAAGSFNYEQLCDISYRVSREYCRGDQVVGHTNYLLGE